MTLAMEKRTSSERKPPLQKRQGSLQVAHYPVLLQAQHNSAETDRPSVTWKTSGDSPGARGNSFEEALEEKVSTQFSSFNRRGSAFSTTQHRSDSQEREGIGCGVGVGNGSVPQQQQQQQPVQSGQSSATTAMLLPSPTHKLSLIHSSNSSSISGPPPFRPNSASSTQLSTATRQELWSLAPTAFHQSFDGRTRASNASLSNSCSHLDDQYRIQRKRRTAFSGSAATRGGAFACGGGSGCNSAAGYPYSTSRPALGGRSPQSSFDSNGDVGQEMSFKERCALVRLSTYRKKKAQLNYISMNLMRVNGTMAPFKGLLQSLSSTTSGVTCSNSPICNEKNPHPGLNSKVSSASHMNRLESLKRLHHNVSSEEGKKSECDILGDASSRKSLSLVLSEDVEGQRNGGAADDSQTPLMKDCERTAGGRLIQRQILYDRRKSAADYALFFAILGIVLMIIESELSAAHVYEKASFLSVTFKSMILLSTAILLILVALFHIVEIQLFMNANSAEDWRIALTWRRVAQIVFEMSICAICPLPFDFKFPWSSASIEGRAVHSYVYLDVWLSIPMFLRLYWLCRVLLLHSRLFTDASSRSIAGLNRVNFNARFILKTLMTLCPGTMLMAFTVSLWVMAGWILRLCERQDAVDTASPKSLQHNNYLNSLWMIAITFLSVGYGDIVPHTYCGRTMAVITGILVSCVMPIYCCAKNKGTCTSSMVVAVIARKLELTRAEKHVHNFMMDTQLTKQLKHSAANVLRETWLIYKYRRLVDKPDPGKIRLHQRKFLVAIYQLRKVKRDQRKLAENLVSLGDVAKTSSNTYELVHDVQATQEGLSMRMTAIEHQLSDICREISVLAELIRSERRRNSGASELSESLRRRKV